MSRSTKRPYLKDYGKATYKKKRFASKAVRSHKDKIPNGKWYRKIFCSWNIFDYICYWPEVPSSYRK